MDGGWHGAHGDIRPKRYTPFEPGVRTEKVLSTFPSIDTAVDNIKISQGLERVAKVMDRGSLIRTYQGADLGFILHSRHQFHWHTGYIPPQSMAVPHIGAVIAKTLGPKNPTVPPFIAIGQNMEIGGESASIKAFHTAGFLGTEFAPFLITDPQDAASAVRPPADLGSARFKSRRKLYEQILAQQPVYQYAGDFQREAMLRSMDAADRLLTSPSAKAFDLSLEPKKSLRRLQHGPFRPGLPAGAAPGGSRRALHRSHYRVHSVPLLGHASGRPRAAGDDEASRSTRRSRS